MKRNAFLLALCLVLLLVPAVDGAWAYFTTYTQARGGYPLRLGEKTEMKEEFSAWTKHVSIENTGDLGAVFVRARAFCDSRYTLKYSDTSGKWSDGGDGFWYYSDVVYPGEATEELLVKIDGVPTGEDGKPVDENGKPLEDGTQFDVIVIYECTPAQYDEAGNPYADWELKLDIDKAEGGGA